MGGRRKGLDVARWTVVVVSAWLAAALVSSARRGVQIGADGSIQPIPFEHAFIDHLVNFGWWAVLTPAVAAALVRIQRADIGLVRRGLLHVVAATVFIGVYFLLRSIRLPVTALATGRSWSSFLGLLPLMIGTYSIIAALVITLITHRRLVKQERDSAQLAVRAGRLETQLAEARLGALSAQLHPHFLANALNGISSLIRSDPAGARRMVARLGELLRMAVEAANTQEIPLTREIEWIERYLEVQQARYEARLEVELHIEPAAMMACVPPLILQPLIENAIKHGIERSVTGGTIVFEAERHGQRLKLRVRNTAADASTRVAEPAGIGLINLRRRLEAVYGHDQQVLLRHMENGGMEAVIDVPYRATRITAATQ